MTILTNRRRFLAGLFAAPAIIPAAKLMKVKAWIEPNPQRIVFRTSLPHGAWRDLYRNDLIRDAFRPLYDNPNVLLERLRFIEAA